MKTSQYLLHHLDSPDLHADPMQQFEAWFKIAKESKIKFPEAMTLATVDDQGWPDARVVLLKEMGPEGLGFYTNYNSPKAAQLDAHTQAAMVFWWPELERQVRVRGLVSRLSAEKSDAYFAKRPRGSQLGALCSPQSQVLPDRATLDAAYVGFEKQHEGKEIPRPDFWGGYLLKPWHFEFWQGRDNRLHDRFVYNLDASGVWECQRLAP